MLTYRVAGREIDHGVHVTDGPERLFWPKAKATRPQRSGCSPLPKPQFARVGRARASVSVPVRVPYFRPRGAQDVVFPISEGWACGEEGNEVTIRDLGCRATSTPMHTARARVDVPFRSCLVVVYHGSIALPASHSQRAPLIDAHRKGRSVMAPRLAITQAKRVAKSAAAC